MSQSICSAKIQYADSHVVIAQYKLTLTFLSISQSLVCSEFFFFFNNVAFSGGCFISDFQKNETVLATNKIMVKNSIIYTVILPKRMSNLALLYITNNTLNLLVI